MRPLRVLAASVSVLAGILATSTTAHAQLITGPADLICKPTAERPYPVVLVHGQAGNVAGMDGVIQRLAAEKFCIYGKDYGFVQNGANGQAHLWDSAAEISTFIDWVLQVTGAQKVNVVGHSAGTGVLDNYILQKGGAAKVHSFVSFGGLHHPYWHMGASLFADLTIHLPNLIAFGRLFFPGLSIQMITDILGGMVGDPMMKATITSPFAKDLFDENYWNTLHGGPSEPRGTFAKIFPGRSLPTHDSVPGICNTNIIALGDMLVNDATGWQDVGSHIENYMTTTVVTGNSHNDQLGNEDALNKMVEGLTRDCGNGGNVGAKNVSALSLNPLDSSGGTTAETTAKERKRQAEFAEAFLKELDTKYGSELERSDRPLPWEPGGGGSTDDDEAAVGGTSACSISASRGGDATMAVAVGALTLVLAARTRRRKTES